LTGKISTYERMIGPIFQLLCSSPLEQLTKESQTPTRSIRKVLLSNEYADQPIFSEKFCDLQAYSSPTQSAGRPGIIFSRNASTPTGILIA
jgi:hypothetical protein